SNSTLKNHISHPHCEALKRAAQPGQSFMSQDGSLFMYNPDVLREQFMGLGIQRGLPFTHFDDEQTTKVFQKHLQPKYNHKMIKRVIAFEDFLSPQSGSALAKTLRNVFVNFNLENKIMSITLDNASNNTSAIGKLKLKYNPPIEDTQEHKQDKSTLETPDAEVHANNAIPLFDEEIALDAASSEGSMSGPGSGGEEAEAEANYGYDVYHDDY
nr:zinc finger BED domain-containing protein RICESLEEPER 2-like [Tanacetum cinerariifolium]